MNLTSSGKPVLQQLPGSIELPAGSGKTETISKLVKEIGLQGKRALILTHTHAGVDVLRRRLNRLGVPNSSFSLSTIDSWCFKIIRNFPDLAEIVVDEVPDWAEHESYYGAGSKAVVFASIARMIQLSHDFLLVDEYQDCQVHQHNFLLQISRYLPTCVFGDRMQGLFHFTGKSVNWETDVLPVFPMIDMPSSPWRWADSNPELGDWLVSARENLIKGIELDLNASPIRVIPKSDLHSFCFSLKDDEGSTAAITSKPWNAVDLAQRLSGSFSLIEEIEGKHLKKFAKIFDQGTGPDIAVACVEYGVACATGVASVISSENRRRIGQGKSLTFQEDSVMGGSFRTINQVISQPTPTNVLRAMQEIMKYPKFRLHRREAWYGILNALRLCEATKGLTLTDAVVRGRNVVSVSGRRPERRIVGRPLLVKGLEYSHAVVVDPEACNAHELYVSLTRGTSKVTVIADKYKFAPSRPEG